MSYAYIFLLVLSIILAVICIIGFVEGVLEDKRQTERLERELRRIEHLHSVDIARMVVERDTVIKREEPYD